MKRLVSILSSVITAVAAFGASFQSLCAATGKADADIVTFVTAKREQTEQTANRVGVVLPSEVRKMFAAAAAGDWRGVSNLFNTISLKYKPYEQGDVTNRLDPEVWYPVQEVGGFCEMLAFSDPKYIRLFANETFKVVPAGSVYFGGTDPGRFVITALSSSHREGRPFFTITQNQLVTTNYLDYLRGMYGDRLKLPGPEALQLALTNYVKDAERRWQHDRDFPNEPRQIRPGEEVQTVNGRPQASGTTAVMEVNGRLAKDIVEANADKEFYVEESYPINWMYPHLSPIGPILQLHHRSLDTLSEAVALRDREYWTALTQRLTGLKITDETSLDETVADAERLKGNPGGFQGERAFLHDDRSRQNFAKLRSAGAGIYAWRAAHAKSSAERRRMVRDAELAFKQACIFHPGNPEALWRYTTFLIELDRVEDAQKLTTAAGKLNPDIPNLASLTNYVQQVIDWKKRAQ